MLRVNVLLMCVLAATCVDDGSDHEISPSKIVATEELDLVAPIEAKKSNIVFQNTTDVTLTAQLTGGGVMLYSGSTAIGEGDSVTIRAGTASGATTTLRIQPVSGYKVTAYTKGGADWPTDGNGSYKTVTIPPDYASPNEVQFGVELENLMTHVVYEMDPLYLAPPRYP